uniref:SSD domain-containing protein n=1 Tax=Meloidogyne hapla TaxID=6305 RepID=A0A1I8BUA4_MELHA
MGIVLALFTPSIVIIFVGSSAVLSINMGVFGILYFWNINLDPISMMTTLTAIGVSVDFVAHISFHYYNSGCVDNLQQKQRLKHALQSIGWPMLQAGLSTVLCVVVLAVIDVYIVQVFVKVVFLVVSLGLIHGLLILPIAYSTILSLFDKNDKNKNIIPTKIYITDVCIYKDDMR